MGALLDHAAFVEDSNLVAELAGGESVADVDCGLVSCDVVELAGLRIRLTLMNQFIRTFSIFLVVLILGLRIRLS